MIARLKHARFAGPVWLSGDFNGDRLGDLAQVFNETFNPRKQRARTLLSRGNGKWIEDSWTVALSSLEQSNISAWMTAEVNGDGSTDLLKVEVPFTALDRSPPIQARIDVLLAAGQGSNHTWREKAVWADLDADSSHYRQPTSNHFPAGKRNWAPVDQNDDGLSDLVQVSNVLEQREGAWKTITIVHAIRNKRGGWSGAAHMPNPETFSAEPPTASPWRPIGIHGDRKGEMVQVDELVRDGQKGISLHVMASNLLDGRLRVHENGLGARVQIGYRTSAGSGYGPMPSGYLLSVVSSVTVRARPPRDEFDQTGKDEITYEYQNPRWSFADSRFLGFARIASRNQSDWTQADGSPYVTRTFTYYDQTPGCALQPSGVWVTNDEGETIFGERNETISTQTAPPYRCLPERHFRVECEGQASCRVSQSRSVYDRYGNLASLADQGEYVDADSNDVDDKIADNRATVWTYVPNTEKYIVGLASGETIYDESAGSRRRIAEAQFEYDHLAWGSPPSVGLRTRDRMWDDSTSTNGTYVDTNYSYDTAGNLRWVSDLPSRKRVIDYDEIYQLFPKRICDGPWSDPYWSSASSTQVPGLCSTTAEWDFVLGKPQLERDPNGQATAYAYDPLGRIKKVIFPDQGCVEYFYEDVGNPDRQRVEEDVCDADDGTRNDRGSSANGLWTARYFDGAGRTHRLTRAGGYEAALEQYGASRGLKSVTVKHSGGGSTIESYVYDAADRLTKAIHSDGSHSEIRYAIGQLIRADELGYQKELLHDVRGNVTLVRENVTEDGPSGPVEKIYETSYQYDPLDRLEQAQDARKNLSTTKWDSLGRVTVRCNPDMGCSKYRYYNDGSPKEQVDAKEQTTGYTYDDLGRLKTKDYYRGGAVIKRAQWFYDVDPSTGQQNGASLGRLTRVEDPKGAGIEEFWYDVRGQVTATRKCVAGQCVRWQVSFDRIGRPEIVTYPDAEGGISGQSEQVRYEYDLVGRPTRVAAVAPATLPYVLQVNYDSYDRMDLLLFGNGALTDFDYDGARQWVKTLRVTGNGGNALFQASYMNDVAGRLKATDEMAWLSTGPISNSLTFVHDELNRLRTVTGSRTRKFDYDGLGNMIFNSAVGTYQYDDTNHVHAVTGIISSGGAQRSYAYDRNGNMTKGPQSSLVWDEDDRPVRVTGSSGTTAFAYDAAGERVMKSASSATPLPGPGTGGVVALAAADGHLFATDRDGGLWVSKLATGPAGWRQVGKAAGVLAMAVTEGRLFAVTTSNQLQVRTAAPSEDHWVEIGDADGAVTLAAADGYLIGARSGEGWLRARPATTEPAVWKNTPAHVSGGGAAAMVWIDGLLYMAQRISGQLWVRQAVLEEDRWWLVGDSDSAVALAAVNGRLYAADGDGRLRVRDIVANPVGWHAIYDAGRTVALAAADGHLYGTTKDNRLRVREAKWGWADWRDIGNAGSVVLFAAADHLLFGVTTDNRLRVRPATPGDATWQDIGDGGDAVLLSAADGQLFAATKDNRLLVRAATAEPDAWRDVGDAGGAVLLAAADGYLFAATTKKLGVGNNRLLRARSVAPTEVAWRDLPYEVVEASSVPDAVAMTALDGMLYLADGTDRLWLRARPDVWEAEETTLYLGPLVELGPSGFAYNYYLGSKLVARRDAQGVEWFHQDPGGSVRIMTGQQGQITSFYDYEPFGSRMDGGDQNEASAIGFGGHRVDSETGLIYMHARYYDPAIGRFISADTIVPDPFNPQALNRYSYVYNNPLNLTDPTGHLPSDDDSWEYVWPGGWLGPWYPRTPLVPKAANDKEVVLATESSTVIEEPTFGPSIAVPNGFFASAERTSTGKGLYAADPVNPRDIYKPRKLSESQSVRYQGELWTGRQLDRANYVNRQLAVRSALGSSALAASGYLSTNDPEERDRRALFNKNVSLLLPPLAPTPLAVRADIGSAYKTGIGLGPAHNANIRVRNIDNETMARWRERSGEMPGSQKLLGRQGSLGSHTEAKGLARLEGYQFSPGDYVEITGQLAPCTSCRGAMNSFATRHGVPIRYQWWENGKSNSWSAFPGR